MNLGVIITVSLLPVIAMIAFIIWIMWYRNRKFNESLAARGYTSDEFSMTRRNMMQMVYSRQVISTTNAFGQQIMMQPNMRQMRRSIALWVHNGMVADQINAIQVLFQQSMDQMAMQRRGMESQGLTAGTVLSRPGEQYPLNTTGAVPTGDGSYHMAPYPDVNGMSPSAPFSPPQFQSAAPPPSYSEVTGGGKSPYN